MNFNVALHNCLRPMKTGVMICLMLLVLSGCDGEQSDKPKVILGKLVVGESVYVCGCPMMCCNSISNSGTLLVQRPFEKGKSCENQRR